MVCGEGHAHASRCVTGTESMTLYDKGKRRQLAIALWIAVALFVLVQASTLTDGHNWGSDFAQYIIHAKNLTEGRDYRQGIWMDERILASDVGQTYPIGFPATLAPLVWLFGADLPVLKAVNIVFWVLWVLVIHRMVRRRAGDSAALWASLILLSSPWFFVFKQNVLSDVPFLFFTTLAIALYEEYLGDGSPIDRLRFAGVLASAAAAMATRSAGLALFAALFLHLAFSRRAVWPAVAALTVPVLIRLAEWALYMPASAYSQRFVYPWDGMWSFATTVLDQAAYSVVMLGKIYMPYQLPPAIYKPVVAISAAILALVLAVRIAKLQPLLTPGRLARIELIDVFFVVYLGMLIIYPQKQGPRFLLPLAGIALIYAIEALTAMVQYLGLDSRRGALVAALLAAGVIHNLVATAAVWNFDDDDIHRPPTLELMAWIRTNVTQDEHYMFHYSRAAALFTGRTGKFLPQKPEDVLSECRERQIRWVILSEKWAGDLINSLRSSPEFREVWCNATFHVIECLPAAGQGR